MAYQHRNYRFQIPQTQAESMLYRPQMQFPGFLPQFPQHEVSYHAYAAFPDYADDLRAGLHYGDFDEISTRPRLTKEQVDILEHEFQKNPKPNSVLKRHLAATTNLNLPRVANWFQNRRAKAKQQRKQEEFEQQQSKGIKQELSGQPADDVDEDEDEEEEENVKQDEEDPYTTIANPRTMATDTGSNVIASPPRSPKSTSQCTDVRDRAHASLQRAIAAAQAAQYKSTFHPTSAVEKVPEMSSGFPCQVVASSSASAPQAQTLSRPQMPHDWDQQRTAQDPWTCSLGTVDDMAFDFGFDKPDSQMLNDSTRLPSPPDSTSYGLVSPQAWESDLSTPTMSTTSQSHFPQPLPSPGVHMTSYVGARRGSIADALTSNFEEIALANAAPHMSFGASQSVSSGTSEAGIDLASRRRRPRPAALTPGCLRSRSYGALTAGSPTFRQGVTPPSAHVLRHVKSTGPSLNSHYPGIRKPSIPQKSPLNFSTFAESEAFQELMAQKAAEDATQQQATPVSTTQLSYGGPQEPMVHSLSQMVHINATSADQPSRPQVHSPPITPYQPDFYLQTSSMMPPSIQAQYASFADYTPPYSAGPMTNSSWSDAPLTSPDLANFPSVNIIPSIPYGGPADDQNHLHWSLSADQSPSQTLNTPTESRKTEFYMQEFPNQKEEHARAAKLLDHPRPKHYAFENKGQHDYSLS